MGHGVPAFDNFTVIVSRPLCHFPTLLSSTWEIDRDRSHKAFAKQTKLCP